MPPDFDFFDADFQENVHPELARMRKECPVAHADTPFDWYAVSREADVRALLEDWAAWSSERGPGLSRQQGGVLVNVDPPRHTADRRLLNRAFSPASLMAMEPEIRELVDRTIDGFVDRGEGDLMELLAVPIPLLAIARLLGMDPSVALRMRSRADGVISRHAHPAQPAPPGPNADFFARMIRERRRALAPAGAGVPRDALTALLTTELDGRVLTDEDVAGFIRFLFMAGSVTTTQLIGNLVHRLLELPDQMERVRARPERIATAVEESLRFDSPVHGLFRTNTAERTLHGVRIPKDTKMLCLFASANRDPECWDDPERFDVDRDTRELKRHYAFGKGIHYCLGAPLARVEARVALERILERLPNLRLTGEPGEIAAPVLHGVARLPVAWNAPRRRGFLRMLLGAKRGNRP